MIIKSLSIENFKGIGRKVNFDFKPITLFFGENSAGKSTVLHALNYLHDILELHSINADTTALGHSDIDLGGFKQFIHNHDLTKKINLGLVLDVDTIDLIEMNSAALYSELFEARHTDEARLGTDTETTRELPDLSVMTELIYQIELDLSISWSKKLNAPYIDRLDVGFNNENIFTITCSSDCRRREITHFNLAHGIFTEMNNSLHMYVDEVVDDRYIDTSEAGNCLIGLVNSKDALPDYRKTLDIADIWKGEEWENSDLKALFRGVLNTLLIAPLEVAATTLTMLRYLGPIREIPSRDYAPRKKEANSPWADGLAAWDALYHEGQPLVDKVNHWLHGEDGCKRLNTGYTVKTPQYKQVEINGRLMNLLQSNDMQDNAEEIRKIIESLPVKKGFLLEDMRRGVDVYPGDVGIGVSQLLPVTVVALSNEEHFISIEQPELHIHPGLQTAIGDLLIYSAKKLGKVFILETHSEHIMLRLLRRIRETTNGNLDNDDYALSPEDINVVYVTCVEGETRLMELGIDEDGEFIDRWPQGFFAERAEELF